MDSIFGASVSDVEFSGSADKWLSEASPVDLTICSQVGASNKSNEGVYAVIFYGTQLDHANLAWAEAGTAANGVHGSKLGTNGTEPDT